MQENLDKTRVIYAEPEETEELFKLRVISHKIVEKLMEKGIMDKELLKKCHFSFDKKLNMYMHKLHLTLLNVLFLNKIEKKQGLRESRRIIDAGILIEIMDKKYTSEEAGLSIGSVNFSLMGSDKVNECYFLEREYKFGSFI